MLWGLKIMENFPILEPLWFDLSLSVVTIIILKLLSYFSSVLAFKVDSSFGDERNSIFHISNIRSLRWPSMYHAACPAKGVNIRN